MALRERWRACDLQCRSPFVIMTLPRLLPAAAGWDGAFHPAAVTDVRNSDQANDQRSIQRSPSRSQFEAIWPGVATFSDVANT